jgi:uncharacterized protein (DUF488 family)
MDSVLSYAAASSLQEGIMSLKIVTIGVYGFGEQAFFAALQAAGVDTLIDIRRRRGVRGSDYAFANSNRLQQRLAGLGIRYLHRLDLAPTATLRQQQDQADKAGRVAKRQRTTLDPGFITTFHETVLADFDPQSLLDELQPDAKVLALLCVEKEPAACHRSLVAEKLQKELNAVIEHILPS